MGLAKIITASEFDAVCKSFSCQTLDETVNAAVREIIAAVRAEGDIAVKRYAARFEKAAPENFEVPLDLAREAWENLAISEPDLIAALTLAANNIRRFAQMQKEQFKDFEAEIVPGLFTGQRIIPVEKAAVYVPAGRFPLVSSALMGLIPAAVAGVGERLLVSPPCDDGLPDRRVLAAAYLAAAEPAAAEPAAGSPRGRGSHPIRIFALGGAQAIAALALGTRTIPRVDMIVGPGNKYVAAAKRLLFGEIGIDFVAGPTDVLIITDRSGKDGVAAHLSARSADLVAADMLAQAEHDPDARARALVPDREMAEQVERALERQISSLDTAAAARASLEAGGLIVVYESIEEAIDIANRVAPEHLELHVSSPGEWMDGLRNYGSLFIGAAAAEALGDYSAGINHTLPTSASARFTGGLSVRNFLKTVTTLRCAPGKAYDEALAAAGTIARAEGLSAHAASAAIRMGAGFFPTETQ
ncbi:MAG: histidinol dehydrogenase [Treponema sp.]|nr:histidinol dehydrogenase [Treponema sp.]